MICMLCIGRFWEENMDKNILDKIEKFELTFIEKIIVKIFRKTFFKVHIETLKNLYKF